MQRASYSFMSDQNVLLAGEEGKMMGDKETTLSNVPQLPMGAAKPHYGSQPITSPQRFQERDVSPPATPSQRLLDSESQPQYASYPLSDKPGSWEPAAGAASDPFWIPYPLRPWFWIPFFVLLVLMAIGLEIALHFRWPANGHTGDDVSLWHYVYTLPPSFAAMILVALWAWTDIEIKKMQPYIELLHGDSPPQRSLLLDYTRSNNFIVWTQAARNKHYLVVLTTLMVLLTLSFQPLASALLIVRNTWWQLPDMTVHNLAHIGLNQGTNFQDLTSFLAAAGFASANVQYGLDNPPFISGPYTVAPFELPTNIPINGTTLFVNTTALKSDPGCQLGQVNMSSNGDGSWTNSISISGCSLNWVVNHTAELIFGIFASLLVECPAYILAGVNATNCNTSTPQFSPVAFWIFQYEPTVAASATICFPSFSLFDVEISYDLAAKNVTSVTELRSFTSTSNFSSAAGNITGPPLNGHAYNGIEFNLSNPDPFILARQAAIQLQLPGAVVQTATTSSAGLQGSFTSSSFVQLSTTVYRTYLTLLAQQVYFVQASGELNTIQVKSIVQRVFLSDVSVHLLAIAMLLLVFFGTIAQLFHRFDRRHLHLRHEPGTIASAVSIGGQTGMGQLLAGRQDQRGMDEVLANKKFRIDPITMKIIMEGEDGYEFAASPRNRRKSVFAAIQSANKRFSRAPM
ncbi:hypothetical protein D9757_002631 [Collybiopsis confluens]|uniref:Uncharacterized protein n=1 Tax=Collybiopsis confluens TaxID=2823264 RepID=A0A8H5HW21_9AGAR|nr:hypothetical protein D9757_002631 [Collybiopsis confluens]